KDRKVHSRQIIPDDLFGRKLRVLSGGGGGGGGLMVVPVGIGGEPSIAIDPANTNHIVISSFASFFLPPPPPPFNGAAPIYYSVDGGSTWNIYWSVSNDPNVGGIPNDQAFDYGRAGILYGAELTFNVQVATGGTADPTSVSAWKWPLDSNG